MSQVVPDVAVPKKPVELSHFGEWLVAHGIRYATCARDLGVTRSYVHSLATKKSQPTIHFAAELERWSLKFDPKNPLRFNDWKPILVEE